MHGDSGTCCAGTERAMVVNNSEGTWPYVFFIVRGQHVGPRLIHFRVL